MKFSPKCSECKDIIELGISCYFSIDKIYFLLIGASYIEVNGDKLHTDCFKCSYCKASLEGQRYYVNNDAFYCQKCDSKQFCPKCARCSAVIPRGI